jgi:hypothetical protein
MKILVIVQILILTLFFSVDLHAVEPETIKLETEQEKEIRYEKVDKLSRKINDAIKNPKINIDVILSDVKRLSEITKDSPYLFIDKMHAIIVSINDRICDEDDKAMLLASDIIDRIIFFDINETMQSSHIMELNKRQIQILLFTYFNSPRVPMTSDCHPVWRKKLASQIVQIYQKIITQIDEKFDPNAKENEITKNSFMPPASHNDVYISGQDMSYAKDKATREAYKAYIEEQNRKANKWNEQLTARSVQRDFNKRVKLYLIDAYSFPPYRTSELEAMLNDNKVDEAMSKEILEAVRKAEKERPYDGFRIWRSSDKLFKAEAKFISAEEIIVNGKQVDQKITLEKHDGKQTTIEFSALRQLDKDYIDRQIAEKNNTPNSH